MPVLAGSLAEAADAVPALAAGPGGALAILRDGEVLESRAWGYADAERRVPFTASTIVPACSITKQFLCAALLARIGDVSRLDRLVGRWLPSLLGALPTARQLCDNQSGLRDYWAQTVLCGAMPEGDLRPQQAMEIVAGMRTGHFAPGTHYSYSNANFRILMLALEEVTGEAFADLLEREVFAPAGMAGAGFHPETADMPGGAVGYEGTPQTGFIRAVNRIHWAGDAGVCLSLDDLIAWERFIDAARDDEAAIYNRLSAPPRFLDGRPARYGMGLLHGRRHGRRFTEHGGGLRGWSLHRLHCAAERATIVVLLNHRAVSARSLALRLFDRLLGKEAPAAVRLADRAWRGAWFDPVGGLLLDIGESEAGWAQARFEAGAEALTGLDALSGSSENLALVREGGTLHLAIERDNFAGRFHRVAGAPRPDVEGAYRCAELDAVFTCGFAGGELYGAFDGPLGRGPMHPLRPVGGDIWRMSCPRAMDAAAPGDWTVRFLRDEGGHVEGVAIGCWLSRDNRFSRVAGGRTG